MPAAAARAALALLALLALTGPAAAELRPRPVLPPHVSDAVVRRYAPLLYLHTQERFAPASVRTFLGRSALLWSRPGADARIAGSGAIRPARMGVRCAAAPLGCYRYRGKAVDELTRPAGGVDAPGFYLSPDPSLYAGSVTDPPLYWEVRRTRDGGMAITYWAFYAYDEPVLEVSPTAPPTLDPVRITGLLTHEGDWERVEVLLSAALVPRGVRYHQHADSRLVRWARVPLKEGHPVALVAQGKHGSFASEGIARQCVGTAGCLVDRRDRGRAIRSWRPGGLIPVRSQPWYGFGGAWGRPGSLADTTGPIGPSRFKR